MKISDRDIPGYTEALKREGDIRDAAFLDLTTRIAGIELRQMTPRDLLILDGLDNPLVSGSVPTGAQLAHFLWLLSPSFRESSHVRCFFFGRKIRKLPFIETVRECWRYMDDTFQDSPGSSGPGEKPFAGWCAHLVDRLSSEYGWPEEKILRTPFKRLYQFVKVIRARKDSEYTPHNPSDKIKREGAIAIFKARTELVNLLKRRAH